MLVRQVSIDPKGFTATMAANTRTVSLVFLCLYYFFLCTKTATLVFFCHAKSLAQFSAGWHQEDTEHDEDAHVILLRIQDTSLRIWISFFLYRTTVSAFLCFVLLRQKLRSSWSQMDLFLSFLWFFWAINPIQDVICIHLPCPLSRWFSNSQLLGFPKIAWLWLINLADFKVLNLGGSIYGQEVSCRCFLHWLQHGAFHLNFNQLVPGTAGPVRCWICLSTIISLLLFTSDPK